MPMSHFLIFWTTNFDLNERSPTIDEPYTIIFVGDESFY